MDAVLEAALDAAVAALVAALDAADAAFEAVSLAEAERERHLADDGLAWLKDLRLPIDGPAKAGSRG